MIEIKGAEMMAVIPETGMIVPMGMIKDATFTLPEPKDLGGTERNIRSLTHSFDVTLETKRLDNFTLRYIINACSNNELRMHHKPMQRRRPKLKKRRWRILKVIRTGRGNLNDKIRVWRRETWIKSK